MANSERNYGYSVMHSYAPTEGDVELLVYRYGRNMGIDGIERDNVKTNTAIYNAKTAESRNDSGGSAGISAVQARLMISDFLATYPDNSTVRNDGMGRLNREANAEIAAAEEEAYAIEAKRLEVAMAVAGMDLATADEMASLEAGRLAEEQTMPVQE